MEKIRIYEIVSGGGQELKELFYLATALKQFRIDASCANFGAIKSSLFNRMEVGCFLESPCYKASIGRSIT